MKKSVRTVIGAILQTAQRFNDPLPILPNSTLNQKFNVFPTLIPSSDDYVSTKYLSIGINGVSITLATNGLYETKYREFDPRWTSLLNPVPFVMRRIQEDLTPAERVKLRMRSIEVHNGVTYACYYLRPLDLLSGAVGAEYRTKVNGVTTSREWEPSLSDLNPVPLTLAPNQVITTGDDVIAATKKLSLVFSANDIQEIMNSVNIIYGSPNFAVISEMALVSGVDRVLTADFNGVSGSYTEAVYAQVNDFIKSTISCPNALLGQTVVIDAGSAEPLLVVENTVTTF